MINARIQADQATVEADYQDAKRRAEAEASKANKAVEAKLGGHERLWDRVADKVTDGIQSIADGINNVIDTVSKVIGGILDAVKTGAGKLIDAARDFVCQTLTEFGDWLKAQVTTLVGTVFPGLAAELNRLIDGTVKLATGAVNAIADGLEHGVSAVCDGLKSALDTVMGAFKAAVQAAATFAQAVINADWTHIGKMLIDNILKALGIDPAAFYAAIENVVDKIITHPAWADEFAEFMAKAALNAGHIEMTGDLLDLVRNDPAMQTRAQQMRAADLAEAETRHPQPGAGVVTVHRYHGKDAEAVEFGGKRAPGNLIGQLEHFWYGQYAPTWRVGANPLTWTLRHAAVTSWSEVHFGSRPGEGYIVTHFHVEDTLDLRPHVSDAHDFGLLSHPRDNPYDAVTVVLGTLWHDVLGRRDDTKVTADWTDRQPLP